MPIANNNSTVKGLAIDKTLYISKESLKNGFTLALQDPTYKIAFFRLAFDCENCDIWVKTIYGDSVTALALRTILVTPYKQTIPTDFSTIMELTTLLKTLNK